MAAHRFPSQAEARRYDHLRVLERADGIRELRLQPRFPLEVKGVLVATYVADFKYYTKSGAIVVEDVKSSATQTAVFKLKARLMKAIYRIEIQIVE